MIGELPLPVPDPESVNERADEILSRVEFRRPPPSLFDRIQEQISEWLGRAFEELLGTGAGTLFAWGVVIVAIGLTLWFVLRFSRTVVADRATGTTPEMIELSRTPAEWRTRADEFEADGRWKDGLLARYRAVVGQLVLEGVLDEIPGRTTGEYRRELVDRRPSLGPAFDEASTLFERAWYGDEPTGAVERDRFVELDLVVAGARR